MTIPCGKCVFCLSNKRNDWTFRLNQELKAAKSAHFITLTYAEGNEPIQNSKRSLLKRDPQLFIKRIRAKQEETLTEPLLSTENLEMALKWPKIKYYLVGEYGPKTKRPHYHAIMFNMLQSTAEKVEEVWKLGYCKTVIANPATIHYTTKYFINKDNEDPDIVQPFTLISNRPPIGRKYLDTNHKWHKENKHFHVISENGVPQRLPRYYKDKIFNIKEQFEHTEQSLEEDTIRVNKEFDRIRKTGQQPLEYEREKIKQNRNRLEQQANKDNKL